MSEKFRQDFFAVLESGGWQGFLTFLIQATTVSVSSADFGFGKLSYDTTWSVTPSLLRFTRSRIRMDDFTRNEPPEKGCRRVAPGLLRFTRRYGPSSFQDLDHLETCIQDPQLQSAIDSAQSVI